MKKLMKKLLCVFLILCMGFMLTACGGNKEDDEDDKDEEKTEEVQKSDAEKGNKLIDSLVEKVAGGANQDTSQDTKIENSESTTSETNEPASVETSNDSIFEVAQGMDWPSDSLVGLPELKGIVTSIYKDQSSKQCTVIMSDVKKQDADAYVKQLEEAGFVWEMELADATSTMYSGSGVDGTEVTFAYSVSDETTTIFYVPAEATETLVEEAIDMTDAAPWPVEFMASVPELQGKITDVANSNNQYVTVYIEYVLKTDFEAYVTKLKENGFTVDANYNTSVGSADFSGYNEKGEWVHAQLTLDGDSGYGYVDMEKPAQ